LFFFLSLCALYITLRAGLQRRTIAHGGQVYRHLGGVRRAGRDDGQSRDANGSEYRLHSPLLHAPPPVTTPASTGRCPTGGHNHAARPENRPIGAAPHVIPGHTGAASLNAPGRWHQPGSRELPWPALVGQVRSPGPRRSVPSEATAVALDFPPPRQPPST